MKRIVNEQLHISDSNPIKARAYDYKSFTYPWHFHGEYEILYVEKGYGQCIIGDSIIDYSDETLLLFGSALPHCMQNPPEYGQDDSLRVNGTIIQFEKDFMHHAFNYYPHFNHYPFSPTQCSKQRLYLSLHRQFHFRLDQLLS